MKKKIKKSVQKFNHFVIGKGRKHISTDSICGHSWFNHFVIRKFWRWKESDFKIGMTVTVLILIAGITTSFQTNDKQEPPKITKEQLRQERLQKRLSEFQKSIERNCREDMMLRASEMVDSILIARAKASRDTIAKPPRPERPMRPELRSPTDSTPIAPLLKNDTL